MSSPTPTPETPETPAPTTTSKTRNEPYFEVAQDSEGWHWVLWSGNGRMVARNALPYDTRKHAVQGAKAAQTGFPKAKFAVVSHE